MSEPYYQQDGITIYHGDCREIAPLLSGVTAVVSDPPYGLSFMGKDWDHGIPGRHFWELIGQACLPGAPLLAFGGTRTYHRLVCAIEDAGFEIRDCIQWIYGSGFPKSLDISKAIDKAAGAEREVVGRYVHPHSGKELSPENMKGSSNANPMDWGKPDADRWQITTPSTEHAKTWNGYGTALKPAHEPICVAMKPLSGTYAQNAIEHGVAGINVDGCRVEMNGENVEKLSKRSGGSGEKFPNDIYQDGMNNDGQGWKVQPNGRWPANVCHDGSDEVVRLFPETTTNATGPPKEYQGRQGDVYGDYSQTTKTLFYEANSGSAARFFKECEQDQCCILCRWPLREVSDTIETWKSTFANNAKQSGWTTKATSDVSARALAILNRSKPLAQNVKNAETLCGKCTTSIVAALVGVKTSALSQRELEVILASTRSCENSTLIQNLASFAELWESTDTTPTMKSLSILFGSVRHAIANYTNRARRVQAAGDNGQEQATRFRYVSKESNREIQPSEEFPLWGESHEAVKNDHPTVKPLALMEYLVRLVTMPERNLILDPFMGSGSTLVACRQAGLPAIGIETEEKYCEIAANRLRQGVT